MLRSPYDILLMLSSRTNYSSGQKARWMQGCVAMSLSSRETLPILVFTSANTDGESRYTTNAVVASGKSNLFS